MYYNLISSMNKTSLPSYTSRTTAFASATAITDTTILNALNTFDLGLISNGLDTKMKALYPFVGETSTTHKYNFMDARDLDVAFRLQFFGGGTFSNNGYLPNGTNTYADTFFNPNSHATLNDMHISFYNRTSAYNQVCLIGCYSAPHRSAIYNGGLFNINGDSWVAQTSSNALGLKIVSRISNSTLFLRSNNINESFTNSSSALPNANINISRMGGYNADYSYDQCSFASIGLGLSLIDMSNLQTIINTFQISLSRQV